MNNEEVIRNIKMQAYPREKKPFITIDGKLWPLVREISFHIQTNAAKEWPTCRLIIEFPIESIPYIGKEVLHLTLPSLDRKKTCKSKEKKQRRTGSSGG